jgi:hypothetical protein
MRKGRPIEVKTSFARPHTVNTLRVSQISTNDHITKNMSIKSTSVLTGSVHTTVNALREAIAVQRMLERDARGGTRYNSNHWL